MSPENPDDGWDDVPDAGGASGGDEGSGPDEGGAETAAGEGGPEGAPGEGGGRRRRRRRRRRPGERGDQPPQAGGREVQVGGEASQHRDERQHAEPQVDTSRDVTEQQRDPQQQRQRDPQQQQRQQQQRQRDPQQQQRRDPQQQRQRDPQQQRDPQHQRQPQQGRGERNERRDRDRAQRRERDDRDRQAMRAAQAQEPRDSDRRGSHDVRGADHRTHQGAPGNDALQAETTPIAPHGSARIEPGFGRGSQPAIARDSEHEIDEPAADAGVAWGTDDGAPAPAVTLAADLPTDAPADDPDPVTWPLVDGPGAQLGSDVATVVGVRFVPAGRISWCDAGDADYAPGERVMVDSERGPRLAWTATEPQRKATRDRGLRRVLRRANEADLKGERGGEQDNQRALRVAKDKAAELKLPLKVFRVEKTGGKLLVYYTSDERLDLRDFVRDVGNATNARLELRQLGVRDEAKVVGGIGSCGLTLCCTTWLPDFVPVSIKMAKDQGLVLSPTKVSGQCGRLKCCLVYEQAGYAELRKGLPKLGKRVIGARGEGRVVEVDVLRQRVRVSYGPGDTEVVPASEVKPMFPSGNQPAQQQQHEDDSDNENEDEA